MIWIKLQASRGPEKSVNAPFVDFAGPYETFLIELHFNEKLKGVQGSFGVSDLVLNLSKFNTCVQSRFSDIKFSDNLWFSDYFTKTIFQFNA